MLKTIFLTLSVIFLTISCSSFAKIYTKKDPNKFYFDDYIDGKNFKHEEAEKQFLKVFPIGSDVDEVMKKIKEGDGKLKCYYDPYNRGHYGCSKKNGFMDYGNCGIIINDNNRYNESKKLRDVKFYYKYQFLDV